MLFQLAVLSTDRIILVHSALDLGLGSEPETP